MNDKTTVTYRLQEQTVAEPIVQWVDVKAPWFDHDDNLRDVHRDVALNVFSKYDSDRPHRLVRQTTSVTEDVLAISPETKGVAEQ